MAKEKAKGKSAGRPAVDPDETKAQKFVRLCTARVAEAQDKIRLVGACADKAGYEYDAKQADNAVKYLQDAVDKVAASFKSGGTKAAKANITL